MNKEKNNINQNKESPITVDETDRRILGILVEDATISYVELGKRVALSAPATHERVKRLRRSGVIQRTTVGMNPQAIRKPLLAFVQVNNQGWGKTAELMKVADYPEVEEIHSVAGDTSMMIKVRTESSQALEAFLAHLNHIPGVVATRTYVVLSTYLERPVQPGITEQWP